MIYLSENKLVESGMHFVLFSLLFISGCDLVGDSKSPGDGLNLCTSHIELSGAVETPRFSGDAWLNGSAFVDSTGSSILWIAFRPGLPNYGVQGISLVAELDRSLQPLAYDLSAPSSREVNWGGHVTTDDDYFELADGTVTLAAVEADRVAGAFELVAENSAGEVAIARGEFNAFRSNGTFNCADVIPNR